MSPRFKPWLLLSLIFIAGIMTGSALTIGLASHFFHAPGAQPLKDRWMSHLVSRLNLTADQQAKIEPILTDSENQIQAVRREDVGRVSEIIQKTNAQISAILTPDQQAELEKMSKDMERNRDKMFPGRKRPWGPGGMEMPPNGGPGGPPPPPAN